MKKSSNLELELLVQVEEESGHKITPAHLQEALHSADYHLNFQKKELYRMKNGKKVVAKRQNVVDYVISCILSNFPDLYPEEIKEAPVSPIEDPAAIERETRRQRKREKLALALQHDDANEGKKALKIYFSFLEEDFRLSLPGQHNMEGRQQYINSLFNGPVHLSGRRVILKYLDDLEEVISKAGAEAGTAFARASSQLYGLISPPNVDQVVSSILDKVNEYKLLPEETPAEEKEGAWKGILSYAGLENNEAKLYIAQLLEQELQIVRQDLTLLRQERKEYGERFARAEKDYKIITDAFEQEKKNANGYQELLLAERTAKESGILAAQQQSKVMKHKIMKQGLIAGVVLALAGAIGVSYSYHKNTQLQKEMGILERKCELKHREEPIKP